MACFKLEMSFSSRSIPCRRRRRLTRSAVAGVEKTRSKVLTKFSPTAPTQKVPTLPTTYDVLLRWGGVTPKADVVKKAR